MDAIVGNGGWLWTIAGVTGLLLCLESCAEDRCNGTLPERPGPNEAGLVLYLHPEQCKYVRGGLIFIDVELYNAGTATRVLSTALSPPQHVVKYEVSDPSGRILPGPLIEFEWKPAAADFMKLEPPLYFGDRIDLSRFYSFGERGHYKIKAVYDTRRIDRKISVDVWRDRVESNSIVLTVY